MVKIGKKNNPANNTWDVYVPLNKITYVPLNEITAGQIEAISLFYE